jgi:HPt (histidine-containing phosphotransfer) domain-containing protein
MTDALRAGPADGLATLDLEFFRSQVMDMSDLADALVESMHREWAALAPSLEPESVGADLEAVRANAHRLKGALGTVGAKRAARVAGDLEQAAAAGDEVMARTHAADLIAACEEAGIALDDARELLASSSV